MATIKSPYDIENIYAVLSGKAKPMQQNPAATPQDYQGIADKMRQPGMRAEDLELINGYQTNYANATTAEEKQYWHLQAEKVRNKYGFSGGLDGTQTQMLPNDFVYEKAPLMDANTLAKQFGLNINAGDIESMLNRATDAKYAVKTKETEQAEKVFSDNLYDMGLQLQDANMKAVSEAAMSGRSAGALAAQQMLNNVGLQQQGAQTATDLANQRVMMGDQIAAERAKNISEAFGTEQGVRQALATLAQQIQANNVQDNVGQASYEGVRYGADQQKESNIIGSVLNSESNSEGVQATREGNTAEYDATIHGNATEGATNIVSTGINAASEENQTKMQTTATAVTELLRNYDTPEAGLKALLKQVLGEDFDTSVLDGIKKTEQPTYSYSGGGGGSYGGGSGTGDVGDLAQQGTKQYEANKGINTYTTADTWSAIDGGASVDEILNRNNAAGASVFGNNMTHAELATELYNNNRYQTGYAKKYSGITPQKIITTAAIPKGALGEYGYRERVGIASKPYPEKPREIKGYQDGQKIYDKDTGQIYQAMIIKMGTINKGGTYANYALKFAPIAKIPSYKSREMK